MADHLQEHEAFSLRLARLAFVDLLVVRALRGAAHMWRETARYAETWNDGTTHRQALIRAERCEYVARMTARTVALSRGVVALRLAAVAPENGSNAPPTDRA